MHINMLGHLVEDVGHRRLLVVLCPLCIPERVCEGNIVAIHHRSVPDVCVGTEPVPPHKVDEPARAGEAARLGRRALCDLDLEGQSALLVWVLDLAVARDERGRASWHAGPVVVDDDRCAGERERVHGDHVLGGRKLVGETAIVGGAHSPLQSVSGGDGRGGRGVADNHA